MSTDLCDKGSVGLNTGCNGDIREGFLEEVVSELSVEERTGVCKVKKGIHLRTFQAYEQYLKPCVKAFILEESCVRSR